MKRHVDNGTVPGLVLLINHRDHEHIDAIGSMSYDSPLTSAAADTADSEETAKVMRAIAISLPPYSRSWAINADQ